MFDYRVKVIPIVFPYPEDMKSYSISSSEQRLFSKLVDALEYASVRSPYEDGLVKKEQAIFLRDWIIEITLQDVILELLETVEWKALKKPIWDHPDHLKKLYKLNEGD